MQRFSKNAVDQIYGLMNCGLQPMQFSNRVWFLGCSMGEFVMILEHKLLHRYQKCSSQRRENLM